MNTLEALTDLLTAVPLTPLQRHWADEYLRDLTAMGDTTELKQRIDDLESTVFDLESERSSLEDDVYDLKEQLREAEESAAEQKYEPGVN